MDLRKSAQSSSVMLVFLGLLVIQSKWTNVICTVFFSSSSGYHRSKMFTNIYLNIYYIRLLFHQFASLRTTGRSQDVTAGTTT